MLDFGVVGVWWASAIGTLVQTIILIVRWLGKRWFSVALYKTDLYRQHLKFLPEDEQRRFLKEVRAPLMKQEGMTEQVNEQAVIYDSLNSRFKVTFAENRYLLQQS